MRERETSILYDRLQGLLDTFVDRQESVRNGLLFIEGPDVRWKGASGLANPDEDLVMLPDDQFNIDSIAKMMTATIVLLVAEAGELGLDDLIDRYLPGHLMDGLHVYEGRSFSQEITIRQLLNHTSGIRDDWAIPAFFDLIIAEPQRRWTPEETIEFVKKNSDPAFPPGTGFQYSDPGYNLLGLIIENVTGTGLQEAYHELLLDPLGMEHTYRPSYESARGGIPGRGPSLRYLDDIECTLLPAVMTADWAGGGLISTVEDLNRFLRAFVRNELFEKPATRDEMFDWVESAPYHNYGLGISRVLFDDSQNPDYVGVGEVWGHTGSSDNFMYYWPVQDAVIIGTLNQISCDIPMYDNVVDILKTLLEYQAE
ncbi:MAG: serine hydrolase domain-containing protein [Candidatus Promineifilaceae bacterium]